MGKASEHPFDERSKTFYTQYFRNRNIQSGRQFEVFSRGRSIDVVTECTEADYAALQESCFAHFQRVNSLELKGPHDRLTTPDLNLIISRIWAIAAKDKVEREEMAEEVQFLGKRTLKEIADFPSRRTVTIISVVRPDRILDGAEIKWEFGFVPTEEPGVYKSSNLGIPIWIIHPDELAIVPKNYPLLPLARGKKLKQFIELCLENEWHSYLHFMMDIAITDDPAEVFEKIMEVLHMKARIRPETALKFDQFLKSRPELISLMPTLEETLQQRQLLGEMLGEQRAEQQSRLQEKHHTLSLLLRHKFPDVPDSVITQVQQTSNPEQLERWTLQILTAETWEGMFGDEIVTM